MSAVSASKASHLSLASAGHLRLADGVVARISTPARHRSACEVALHHRPARSILVSHDKALARSLAQGLPAGALRVFENSDECLEQLRRETATWETDLWAQQEIVSRWHAGSPLIPLVLRYWASSAHRKELSGAVIADGETDVRRRMQVLEELDTSHPSRVLLLRACDMEVAVRALQTNIVDALLFKDDVSVSTQILHVVQSLLSTPNPRIEQIWYSTLSPQHLGHLRRPDVAEELHAYLSTVFSEWVFLGDPFGALGLDAQGDAHWLQLEAAADFEDAAEMSLAVGMSRKEAEEVRSGRKVSDIGLRTSLLVRGARAIPARQVGRQPGLVAGLIRLADINTVGHKPAAPRRSATEHVPALSTTW